MYRVVCPYCSEPAAPAMSPVCEVVETAKTLGSLSPGSDWVEDVRCGNPACECEFWVGLNELDD